MAATCPKCQGVLSWPKLRDEFACPHCGAPLTAKTTTAAVTFIILWTIADIPVRAVVYLALGDDGLVALAVRIIASGAVGVLIGYLVLGNLSTVTVRPGT